MGATAIPANCSAAANSFFAALDEGLSELNASIGKQFLQLAAPLQSLSQQGREITAISQRVTALAAPEDSRRAIQVLHEVLDDAGRVQRMVDTSGVRLQEVMSSLRQVPVPLLRLVKLRSTLKIVGTLSRIENSRLTDMAWDLSSLAVDIDKLAEQIERHITKIGDQAGAAAAAVVQGLSDVEATESHRRQQAADLFARTRSMLKAMGQRAEASRAAAIKIDREYASIRSAVDQVVMSLQAQDIGRQRIEHVQQVLGQVAALVREGESLAASAGPLALQRAQLLATRDLLSAAVESTVTSLQSLLPRVDELIAQTSSLESQTSDDGHSLAAAIGDGLKAVVEVFDGYSTGAQSVVSTVAAIVPTIAEMAGGVKAVEDVQISINLIALNAAITTAHLRQEGAAMSVIAHELQQIASQSLEPTQAVLQNLQRIQEAINTISQHSVSSNSALLNPAVLEQVKSTVNGSAASLSEAGEHMAAELVRLTEVARTLRSGICSSCDQAVHAKLIGGAFDALLEKLDAMLEECGYTPHATDAASGTERVTGISGLYSMHAERALHEQMFGAAAVPGDEAPANLDDGIELF